MTKSLEQFKRDTLGGQFGNPGSGTYAGQCVSYVRLYMEEVLGIKTGVWGNAVDYWTNPAVLNLFDRVSSPQNGDIGVYGDDPGNWTGPEGHIFIYDNGQMLNQNYNGSFRVSVDPIFAPGFLGYLRLKGGDMAEKVNLDTARILSSQCAARDGYDGRPDAHKGQSDDDLKKNHVGKDLTNEYIRTAWFASDEASRAFGIKQAVYKERDALRKQVAAVTAKPGDSDKKLQAIKDILGVK